MGHKTKQEKRKEAEARKEKWDKLSKEDKIKKIKSRRGESKRELAILTS